MKISIQGDQYPLFEAIGGAALGDLKVLNKRGVTVKTIKASFEKTMRVLAGDGDGVDLLDDIDYLENMVGVVFLALRAAGHNITVEDAERVPAVEVFVVLEDEDFDPKDEPAEPQPTSTT